MTITEIQEKLKKNEFEISVHAFKAAVDEYLSLNDVVRALITNAEIIEKNQSEFRCLVYCKSKTEHIHVVVDYHDFAKDLCVEI